MKLLYSFVIFCIVIFSLFQSGCRYDKPALVSVIPCDTSNITFSGKVQPILAANCLLSGCHAGSSPPNGVFLDTYAHVKAQLFLVNGIPQLLGVVTHAAGFTPMPKDQPKLDTCTIYKIKKWIAEGALNN